MNKANEWSLGSLLRITKPIDVSQPNASRGEAYWSYSDLDELIVSHIKQMSLKVGELMAHDKFKGDKAALDNFLSNSLMVNPNISAYGFAINKDPKKPGLFMVTFRANDGAEPHSWPIWVVPGAFVLKGAEHGDVAALCNGFKRAYTAEIAAGGAGTRMPMRTPRYPGGATPFGAGGAAAAGGRTPNPLREQQAAAAVASIGAGTGRNPLFNSGRTPMGAGAGGRTPLVVGGRTPVLASGRTPIVGVGADGRTPNPYASTVGTGKTPIPQHLGADPRLGGRTPNPYSTGVTPQYSAQGKGTPLNAAGGRTPAYPGGNRTPAYQPNPNGGGNNGGGGRRW
ncbi:BZ3500_MvSof-1268-A1-R1_Chr8-2g10246 [Microbotryum saponariae]|uniref:BZ3500_MvSof-1268-A1-R1_Chr8-2g10246 protein n=1 Tax=Microbotryum saponariae TaxID=289078 RepID=A0A2X0L5X3_9BASI|nr:BZ3500_MvSof-1268-A1-R1_Chr8-2g10246 [Microbotryum saponariae]SDA02044.1 BZ3501_MvSof-1269-A2-R1_Chr8-2g09996 [Microbotryum saponariae]